MTGTPEICFEDVVRAGRVLFGSAFAAEASGWREDLRAVYRRRAMETHPDRARALGRPEVELLREFRAVADAYRLLSTVRAGPISRRAARRPAAGVAPHAPRTSRRARTEWARGSASPSQGPRAAPRADASRGDSAVRKGSLPLRRLRLAEYLYYSGRVRWTQLADAIAWQRAQRPPLGRIAVSFGFLHPDDIGVLLERRREAGANGVLFGEWAVRLGYLTSFQLLAALGRQHRLQRPIGQFFVERDLLDAAEIDAVRRGMLRHNARFP